MPARTTLIRLTLSMLAITAVIGAIAVLMPPEEPGWRMASSEIAALSAIAALVACGLLLLLSRDDATKRPTLLQITWFVWVTGLLLLFLTHIWKDSFYFPMYFDASFTHQFIMWSLIGLGSIAMAVPILRNRAIFPRLGWQLSEALTLIGAAVALLASLYFDRGMKTDGLALALSVAVAVTVGLTSSLAAICAMPLAAGVNLHFVSPRHRILARVGICASLLSANLWIVMFLELLGFEILYWSWRRYQDLESSVHILLIASLISLTISIAVACWTMMRPMRLRGWTAFLLKASIGLVLVGHVIAAIMAIGPPDPVIFGRKSFDRFDPVRATLVLDACIIVAMLLMSSQRHQTLGFRSAECLSGNREFPCPRCHTIMPLRHGPNMCRSCGLLAMLDFREGRCPGCDYDLRGGHVPTCPECGRDLPKPLGHPA